MFHALLVVTCIPTSSHFVDGVPGWYSPRDTLRSSCILSKGYNIVNKTICLTATLIVIRNSGWRGKVSYSRPRRENEQEGDVISI